MSKTRASYKVLSTYTFINSNYCPDIKGMKRTEHKTLTLSIFKIYLFIFFSRTNFIFCVVVAFFVLSFHPNLTTSNCKSVLTSEASYLSKSFSVCGIATFISRETLTPGFRSFINNISGQLQQLSALLLSEIINDKIIAKCR